jgi:hypothetical protein
VNSPHREADPRATVFLLGSSTVIAQALLLREAMAAMGGSELAWGTVMALWLAGVSVGARVGVRWGSPALARRLPVVVIALAGLGVIVFRAAPALVGASAGETITTASAAWLWVVAVLPAALSGGLAFPVLAHLVGGVGGGRAYALEAAGALVGGVLLSLVLVQLGAAGSYWPAPAGSGRETPEPFTPGGRPASSISRWRPESRPPSTLTAACLPPTRTRTRSYRWPTS